MTEIERLLKKYKSHQAGDKWDAQRKLFSLFLKEPHLFSSENMKSHTNVEIEGYENFDNIDDFYVMLKNIVDYDIVCIKLDAEFDIDRKKVTNKHIEDITFVVKSYRNKFGKLPDFIVKIFPYLNISFFMEIFDEVVKEISTTDEVSSLIALISNTREDEYNQKIMNVALNHSNRMTGELMYAAIIKKVEYIVNNMPLCVGTIQGIEHYINNRTINISNGILLLNYLLSAINKKNNEINITKIYDLIARLLEESKELESYCILQNNLKNF